MRADLPTAYVSCFDKDLFEEGRSFWKKVLDQKEIEEVEKRPVLLEGSLYRNKLEAGKDSHFVLKQGLLFYKESKDSFEIAGIAKLGFQKIEVFQSSSDADEKIYSIKLYSGINQTKLISRSKETILEWFTKLSPMLINRDFFSKYELKEMIGEGAFSQVYKVVDRKSGMIYAGKVIKHKMIYSDKRGVLLMKQEIDIMRQLNHPNVVKMIEVQEVNNAVIVILEHIHGCELKKLNMQLTFQESMIITKSLVEVAAYMENLGIVHRDLKPSNIMVALNESTGKINKYSAKIIDFGLAAFLNEKLILTKCGTPGYIAPEILNQSSRDKIQVNQNVDVYSIGIILYEMIYKCNPFKDLTGKNDSKKVVRRNAQSYIDFSKLSPYQQDIDKRITDFIKLMCHREETQRPLASVLLQNPVILKGSSLWINSDYNDQIEEKVVNKLMNFPYSFKVNSSKFSQDSMTSLQMKSKLGNRIVRPPALDLEILADEKPKQADANSPAISQVLSPLNNKSKYIRVPSSNGEGWEEKNAEDGASNASLEKRFRGMRRSDSPLIPERSAELGIPNSSRNSFRTATVSKMPGKSQASTKKNTGYESTIRGGLFVLQKCENKEVDPNRIFYD